MPDLPDLLPDLLTDNPRIRAHLEARIIDLIDDTFDELHDILETGDRASKAAVAKQLLPVFLKVRRDTDEDDTADAVAINAETRDLITAMGESMPGAVEFEEVAVTSVDPLDAE